MKKNRLILIICAIIIILGIIVLYNNYTSNNISQENQILDMLGRTVNLPDNIDKVGSISASTTVALYMLTPEKMIGWNEKRSDSENKYMNSSYKSLPVIGGGKNDANYENIISLNPDIILIGHGGTIETVDEIQQKFGSIPTVDVEGDNNLTNITESLQFMGKVVGNENQSNELIDFYNKMIQKVNSTVSQIPENQRKKVYYARDSTGLMSNPPGSSHTQLIEICGGKNVVQAPITKGSVGVSMELILEWNPDVIICADPTFYNKVLSDPLWQDINAVKEKQVYLVPNSPFSWFESPPGANTIIGIPWTAKILYPDKFKDLDLKSITQEFYSKFYHYNLTDEQASHILTSSGIKNT